MSHTEETHGWCSWYTETAPWFASSPALRPDLRPGARSPLHANRDWLRVLVPTPEQGGDHGEP
jgi:hypothetical protein